MNLVTQAGRYVISATRTVLAGTPWPRQEPDGKSRAKVPGCAAPAIR